MTGPPDSLVDEASLESFLSEHLGGEGPLHVERHQAGHSNETFFLTWDNNELVLRRPPRGAFLPTAHDVAREFKVLSALEKTPVRVPKTLLRCEDASVIGAPFYLMERVHGLVIRSGVIPAFVSADLATIGDELVDALVELHSVDPLACGLAEFGKATGYLERQLRRWSGQMELTLPLTRPVPALERVHDWLAERIPSSPSPTVVHGDFKLDNMMYSFDSPTRLVAVLDWEMATLGDPLADVGWMASFWRDPGDREGVMKRLNDVTAQPGFRRRNDLLERYAAKTDRDLDDLDWYRVLAMWKLAILLEGSYARHLAGMTDDPFFGEMERGVPELAEEALSLTSA